MKKLNQFVFGTLMLAAVLTGCSGTKGGNGTRENFKETIQKFKGYEAQTEITFLKETQENTIVMKQQVKDSSNYKLIFIKPEYLKDVEIDCQNAALTQYNPDTRQKVACKARDVRNEILLTSFIDRYKEKGLKSQETMLDGEKADCFETEIPGGFKYMAFQKIWFKAGSSVPLKMEICGQDHQTTILIKYEAFKYY